MPPEKSLGVGWDSLKFSFHWPLLLIMLYHQAFVLVLSRIIQIFDHAIVISNKVCVEDVNIVSVAFLVFEEYSITHYKSKDCLDLEQNEEATSDCYQWPSIQLWLWIPWDCWIRHFSSTANSKCRWQKNIRIRDKSVYTAKLSGFKSFWIQSSHFRFRIQHLRRHRQTGMFSIRICCLVCKR